jgi:hypothetical protein
MAGDTELDDLGLGEGEDERPKIAKPPQQYPVLRGVTPPPAAAVPPVAAGAPEPPSGSLGGLESSASRIPMEMGASLRQATQPDQPTPLQAKTAQDQARQQELSKGSGIAQIGNKYARGALRGLNVLGTVAAPFLPGGQLAMQQIPGTEEHHQVLEHQNQKAIKQDAGQAKDEAGTAKDVADTEEAQARAGLARAQTGALGEPKPKEEKWDAFANFTDTDGTPLIKEENSGQVVRASDLKPPTGFKASAPKTERPDTPEQQFLDEYQQKHPGSSIADAEKAFKAIQPPEKPGAGEGRADKSYQFNAGRLDKLAAPIEQRAERIGRLEDTLNQNNPQADTLIAPELLTVMAGGQGSGLRMNEAEIARIIGGRDQWENIKAKLAAWQTDPTKPFAFQPAQRQQIRNLFAAIRQRVGEKAQILDEGRAALIESDDPKEHRRIVQQVQQKLDAVDSGKGGTAQQGGVSGKAVSLKDAKALPQNKGKTDDEIKADIQAHGHTVTE